VSTWLSPYTVDSNAYGWGTPSRCQSMRPPTIRRRQERLLGGHCDDRLRNVEHQGGPRQYRRIGAARGHQRPGAGVGSGADRHFRTGTVTIAVNEQLRAEPDSDHQVHDRTGDQRNGLQCLHHTRSEQPEHDGGDSVRQHGGAIPGGGSLTIGVANGATNTPQSTKTLNITTGADHQRQSPALHPDGPWRRAAPMHTPRWRPTT